MKKQGSFGASQARFKKILTSTQKTAGLSTEQGAKETGGVSTPSSDPEVKELLPSGGNPPEAAKTLADRGVDVDGTLPNTSEPKKEEKETKETDPGAKLAGAESIGEIQDRLAANLKLAAEQTEVELKKAATGIASIGDEGGIPPKPEGGKDLSLGTGESVKSDTSGSTPKIDGAQGVTQTAVGGAGGGEKLPQGTKEESVKLGSAEIDLISQKVARFTQNVENGRAVAHQIVDLLKTASVSPEAAALQKEAAAVEVEIVANAANSLVKMALDQGIITPAQSEAIMKVAGFVPNPLFVALEDLNNKVAALAADERYTVEQKIDYLGKVAAADPAAIAQAQAESDPTQGGQPAPGGIDPQELHAAIGQLIAELHAKVQSGEITEDQALDALRQQGLPVDEILQQLGGGAAGGAPAAGGPGPEAAAAVGDAMGASQPGADGAGAVAPAATPDAGAAVAPAGEAAVPAEAAPAVAVPAEGTPAHEASETPSQEKKEDGGEKKEKSEGGEKKEEKKDKKKDEDKEKSKEAILAKVAALLGKQADGEQLPPNAGGGDAPAAPSAPTPDASPEQAGGAQDPQALLQEILSDLEKAVQSGLIPAEAAQAIAQTLAGGAGGGAPGGGAPPEAAGAAAPAPGGAPAA